ncbi:anti-sigma factor family protein [Cohnella cholangitidis]|uniref:Anti-sigma-W factor RsiW n=1 Tax=Cohnella cholangitidis TaxID=2598458 RepID=A0A7G5BU29_9BACL|nr:zf-HC2 domain-containing protein [Cohnella cholangitidis]QMV40463.1 hypothetical protein FPL14_04040 [Cohnella cholangitidis]
MICQEVMELMQRYIDGDLDQQETSLMMDHAGQCPDCAAMLARLQKLSSELEQLPRVVPKYSLVDAILPELDRLHAAESSKGLNVSQERSDSSAPTSTPSGRSNRPARHLFGKISGAVAAGIVAGLLLFSNPGQWTLGGTGSNNEAAAPSPAAAPASEGSSALMMRKGLEDSPEAKMESKQQGGVEDQAGGAEPRAFSGAQDSNDAIDSDSGKKLDASANRIESVPVAESPLKINSDNPAISGYSVPAAAVDSPDGKWKAIAVSDGGTFQVYLNEDGSEYYSSQAKDGKISLLSWNDESTLLYFTFTDAEGNESQWQFDVAAAKESKR